MEKLQLDISIRFLLVGISVLATAFATIALAFSNLSSYYIKCNNVNDATLICVVNIEPCTIKWIIEGLAIATLVIAVILIYFSIKLIKGIREPKV